MRGYLKEACDKMDCRLEAVYSDKRGLPPAPCIACLLARNQPDDHQRCLSRVIDAFPLNQ